MFTIHLYGILGALVKQSAYGTSVVPVAMTILDVQHPGAEYHRLLDTDCINRLIDNHKDEIRDGYYIHDVSVRYTVESVPTK